MSQPLESVGARAGVARSSHPPSSVADACIKCACYPLRPRRQANCGCRDDVRHERRPNTVINRRSDRVSSTILGSTPRPRGSWSDFAADATTIRVLTLNAHQGFSALRRLNVLSQIRDELRADDAHLVFLQEIGGAEGD